jgi:agmatinase
MLKLLAPIAALLLTVQAHDDHSQEPLIEGPHKSLWYNTLPGDGGTQVRALKNGNIKQA